MNSGKAELVRRTGNVVPVIPVAGSRRKLTGDLTTVLRRAAELEQIGRREGLVATREMGMLATGHTVLLMSFAQRPVPRRWYHDWRSVTAVAVCALLGVLGCLYAVYRAVVAIVAGVVTGVATALPYAAGILGAVVLGAIVLAMIGGGGRTFSGTFRGKIH